MEKKNFYLLDTSFFLLKPNKKMPTERTTAIQEYRVYSLLRLGAFPFTYRTDFKEVIYNIMGITEFWV